MQGVRDEFADIVESERSQHDLLDPRSRIADGLQHPQKRVRGTSLVVPVAADQKQVPHFRVRGEMLEEVEGCCIQPLQIIEEQRERMLRFGEGAEEPPDDHLEAVLRLSRREVRNGRLFSDDELQLGNEVHDELTVLAERLSQRVSPTAKLRLTLSEDRANKTPESLCESGVPDAAFVLVELAGREQATRRDQRLMQLVCHRGFANPGIAGHEHELRDSMVHVSHEGSEQRVDLALAPVKLLRDEQTIWRVVR